MTDERPTFTPPRDYFNRREQFRLLALVISLGLVILLISEASKPENWFWLTGEGVDQADQAEPTANPDNIDTSYQPEITPEVPLDEFRILPDVNDEAEVATHLFPGVVPAYLDIVEDNRPHHPHEAMAWFNLWEVLSVNNSKLINNASTGHVSFVELYEQPKAYRGELVTIAGNVRRAERIAAGQNNLKIDSLYKLTLQMTNGPARPVFLYVLNLPDTFPTGDKLDEDIVFTAFFYKNWPYLAKFKEYVGPVLLARDFEWIRAEDTAGWSPTLGQIIGITLAVAVVAVGLAYLVFVRSGTLSVAASEVAAHATAASVAKLNEIEVGPSVSEQLREIAEKQ